MNKFLTVTMAFSLFATGATKCIDLDELCPQEPTNIHEVLICAQNFEKHAEQLTLEAITRLTEKIPATDFYSIIWQVAIEDHLIDATALLEKMNNAYQSCLTAINNNDNPQDCKNLLISQLNYEIIESETIQKYALNDRTKTTLLPFQKEVQEKLEVSLAAMKKAREEFEKQFIQEDT